MSIEPLILGAVIAVSLTSIYILISKDWRFTIAALAIQYVGVFLLVSASWSIEMAVTKMVAGWMAGAILGIAMTSGAENRQEIEKSITFGPVFRLIAATILAITITSLVIKSESWLSSISLPVMWASFFLVGMGLLQLSLTSNPMRVIVGLLTALSGFEIIYAAIESSVLVTGLLAGVNLGLALVGAYLLIAPTMELSK
jgi:hypothetical protein